MSWRHVAVAIAAGIGVLLLSPTGPNAAPAPKAPTLSLQREGGDLYLAQGRARLKLLRGGQWLRSEWGSLDHTLPGDRQVLLVPDKGARILERGKVVATLSLRDTLEKWLPEDAVWGGPSEANQVRYMHGSAGGVGWLLANGVVAGESVLAVLSWRALGPSGEPILAQHLVRITAGPDPAIEMVRRLDVPSGWLYGLSWYPVLRLFRYGSRLLLYTKPAPGPEFGGPAPPTAAELVEISPAGKTVRVVACLPSRRYPLGLLGERWLVLGEPDEKAARPLWILDLRSRGLRPLPGNWKGYFLSSYVYVPAAGTQILVARADERVTHVVTIPGGHSVSLPNPSGSVRHYLWQGMAIMVGDETVSVYSAATGKRIALLQIPR